MATIIEVTLPRKMATKFSSVEQRANRMIHELRFNKHPNSLSLIDHDWETEGVSVIRYKALANGLEVTSRMGVPATVSIRTFPA